MAGHVGYAAKSTNVHALAGFLDTISFDFFCTFTTRKPISINSTRRIAEKVCERIDATSNGSSSFFWAAEKFDVREGFHFHGLIKNESLDKFKLFDWYFTKYGRCQVIDNREPDRQLAASYYCAKYITKELTDYDIILTRRHRGNIENSSKFDRKLTTFDKSTPFVRGTFNDGTDGS